MTALASTKRLLEAVGCNPRRLYQRLSSASLGVAAREQGLVDLMSRLRAVVPDLSDQYSMTLDDQDYRNFWEAKLRGLHAFQTRLALDAMARIATRPMTIADIGDSAGTHGQYLKALADPGEIDRFVSVNLDPQAVRKIKDRGGDAILCRAEDMDHHAVRADLYLGFEVVEHLTDPVRFLHGLAEKGSAEFMAVTLPYRRRSRFGGDLIRQQSDVMPASLTAEQVHILELSPEDWMLLARFAGWTTLDRRIYLQYPRFHPLRSMSAVWRRLDFEGFLGLVLQRDPELSGRYRDW